MHVPRRPVLSSLLLATTLFGAGAGHAAAAPDVRELMSPQEFGAAGLDKLTPAEIEALNRWLLRYTAGEAAVLRTSSDAVRAEARKTEATVIRSRIAGPFEGWSGRTLFRLENGQLWQQRMSGSWRHRAESPEVEIRKNLLGMWEMRMVEGGRQVGVTRIE
jgi:hypothetical protein